MDYIDFPKNIFYFKNFIIYSKNPEKKRPNIFIKKN